MPVDSGLVSLNHPKKDEEPRKRSAFLRPLSRLEHGSHVTSTPKVGSMEVLAAGEDVPRFGSPVEPPDLMIMGPCLRLQPNKERRVRILPRMVEADKRVLRFLDDSDLGIRDR